MAPLDHLCYQCGPYRLVAGAEPFAGITMKIPMKTNQISKVRVSAVSFCIIVDSPLAFVIPDEYTGDSLGEFLCVLPQVQKAV